MTPKQKLFVKEYLVDLNATQAAIRAGYSKKTAYSIGEENLRKPELASAIQAALDKRAAKCEISAEDVLNSILTIRGMALDDRRLNEALKANELIGKHLKLFTDRVAIEGNIGITIVNEFED